MLMLTTDGLVAWPVTQSTPAMIAERPTAPVPKRCTVSGLMV